MSKRRSAYPPEFRRQMVELVRSARNPEELSREFEPMCGYEIGPYLLGIEI